MAGLLCDFTLLTSFDDPGVDPTLSHLCYISRLTVQLATTMGADAQNLTGLLEPASRINSVKFFASQFDDLQRQRFPRMSEVIEIAFLSSRLQLWSFAMHDDVPLSLEVCKIIHQAEQDAIRLIQVACEKNLSLVPFYVCRSISYSVLVLLKISRTPYANQHELIKDQIERALQALGSTARVEDDINQRICRFLRGLASLEDKTCTTPVRSRMTASIVYNALHAYEEHIQVIGRPVVGLDLDGFNWDDFNLMYNNL